MRQDKYASQDTRGSPLRTCVSKWLLSHHQTCGRFRTHISLYGREIEVREERTHILGMEITQQQYTGVGHRMSSKCTRLSQQRKGERVQRTKQTIDHRALLLRMPVPCSWWAMKRLHFLQKLEAPSISLRSFK